MSALSKHYISNGMCGICCHCQLVCQLVIGCCMDRYTFVHSCPSFYECRSILREHVHAFKMHTFIVYIIKRINILPLHDHNTNLSTRVHPLIQCTRSHFTVHACIHGSIHPFIETQLPSYECQSTQRSIGTACVDTESCVLYRKPRLYMHGCIGLT